MADLVITAANVLAPNAARKTVTAGGTIARGDVVYKHTTGKYHVADNTTALSADAEGIALADVDADQPLHIALSGPINVGATLAVGTVYALSETGAICPIADVGTGDYVTLLGVATAADSLVLSIQVSGVAKA